MMGANKTWFLVLVTDWTEISTHNLKIGVLTNEVIRHLEHAKMVICNRIKGAACYEDNWLLSGGM